MVQKILIVEDSDAVRDVMRSILKHSGYDVTEAENGYEALDTLGREVPHLVITDIAMPRMGGVELIKRMADSQELCGIPIVVVSANFGIVDQETTGQGQVVAWVDKPFRIKELLTVVQEGLERTRENCLEKV